MYHDSPSWMLMHANIDILLVQNMVNDYLHINIYYCMFSSIMNHRQCCWYLCIYMHTSYEWLVVISFYAWSTINNPPSFTVNTLPKTSTHDWFPANGARFQNGTYISIPDHFSRLLTTSNNDLYQPHDQPWLTYMFFVALIVSFCLKHIYIYILFTVIMGYPAVFETSIYDGKSWPTYGEQLEVVFEQMDLPSLTIIHHH